MGGPGVLNEIMDFWCIKVTFGVLNVSRDRGGVASLGLSPTFYHFFSPSPIQTVPNQIKLGPMKMMNTILTEPVD